MSSVQARSRGHRGSGKRDSVEGVFNSHSDDLTNGGTPVGKLMRAKRKLKDTSSVPLGA